MWFSRKYATFFVVLLAVSLSLSAFPSSRKNSEGKIAMQAQETQVEIPQETTAMPPAADTVSEEKLSETVYATEPKATLKTLSELSTTYSEETRLDKAQLEDLKDKLVLIQDDVRLMIADSIETEAKLAEVEKLNAQQADDLAYLRGAYDKETSTKAMAEVGAVLGFEDNEPVWGVSGAIGARFGKGFIAKLGAQYIIGDFESVPSLDPNLDRLTLTSSIGWEW